MAKKAVARGGNAPTKKDDFEATAEREIARLNRRRPTPPKMEPKLTTAQEERAAVAGAADVRSLDTPAQAGTTPAPVKQSRPQSMGERPRTSTSKPAVSITVETSTRARLKDLANAYGMKMLPLVLHAVSVPDVTTTIALVQDWQRQVEERQRKHGIALLPGMEVPRSTLRTRERPIDISLRLGDATKNALSDRAALVGADGIGQLIDVCVAALPDTPVSQ